MNKEELIEVLSAWNYWKKDLESGVIREEYLDKLSELVKTGQVVAITGVRRSGKSTLMKQFIQKSINLGKKRTAFLYVNFEEPQFTGMLSAEFLQRIYEAYKEIVGTPGERPCILLDEIQNIPEWERFVRGLNEKNEADIIISGSSSKIFSKELGNILTGRWIELRMYPLSFREFLSFRGLKISGRLEILSEKALIKKHLREYLEAGGFPLVALKGMAEEILPRYLDDIITRDIGERYRIRDTAKLRALARYYLTNFASPVSYRKAAAYANLSPDSVERLTGYMEESLLFYFVPRFSYSLKEQQANPRKVYAADCGIINTAGFRFSENIGRLYENAVFLQLKKQGKEIYYHKGRNECDYLVMEERKIKQAIQVSYTIDPGREREIKGLMEAMNEHDLAEGIILTDDYEETHEKDGKTITFRPLWKWLTDAL